VPGERCTYDYAVIRVVPRVEREEFVNAGVIVSCPERKFLEAAIELDEARLLALDPSIDLVAVHSHLAAIPAICAGRFAPRERFRWLTAPRSTIVQTSPAHAGRCDDPAGLVEHLLATMVRPAKPAREPA
jgi:hypothetical protein